MTGLWNLITQCKSHPDILGVGFVLTGVCGVITKTFVLHGYLVIIPINKISKLAKSVLIKRKCFFSGMYYI